MNYKLFILLISFTVVFTSCKEHNTREIRLFLNNNYFHVQFNYEHNNDSTWIEFFSDSLYAFRFSSAGKKYAQIGKWKLDRGGTFTNKLIIDEYSTPFELEIIDLTDELITKSEKGIVTFNSSLGINIEKSNLLGTWTNPSDSFMGNAIEYKKGIHYVHPTFTFSDSTYHIRVDDVMVNKSTYRVLKSSGILILEEGQYYPNNPLIIVTYLTNDRLNLRIKDNMGWKEYQLNRLRKDV
ncbi:MAG: hypothetical protein AAF693_21990 [Bacteroidota bacterium]